MTGLRILHAPLHAPSAKAHPAAVLRALRGQDATSIGMTEAYGILDELAKMRGFRVIVESGGADRRRGQNDNPMLVRKSLRSLGSGQIFGSAASTPVRIAPERWITFSAVRVPDHGAVCHIGLHPHAAIQDDSGRLRVDIDRGRRAEQQIDALDRLLDYVKANNWLPVVTGDLNFRDKPNLAGPTPHKVLRAHGLDVHAHGFDVIAGHKRLGLEVDVVLAPASITDHPWLLGTAA